MAYGWGGFPPARSALRLRRILAAFGLVLCGVTAGLFAANGVIVVAVLLAALAVVAIVDLVVVQQRINREHPERF